MSVVDFERPEVMRFRNLWIEYDELKRLANRLGCEMLKSTHDPQQIESLFESVTLTLRRLRTGFKKSLMPQ